MAKSIGKNRDWYLVVASCIGNVIQGLIQKQIYVHVNLFKSSFGCFFAWPVKTLKSGLMTIEKDLHVRIFAFVSVLVWHYQYNWPQLDISPCSYQWTWPQLDISSYSLGRRLMSALVLTSHLKCQIILLILLCLAAPFFNDPRLFLLSIIYVHVYSYQKWTSLHFYPFNVTFTL